MNAIAIILGIVIIILIYVLYKYFTSTATTLQSSLVDLKISQPEITKITNPTNTQYAYGLWVYVNNWDAGSNKVFFSHQGVLNVYLLKDQPSLCVDVTMSDKNIKSTIITQNFPLQKWVYIIVSLDNQFLDVYLDGKLVKSARLSNTSGSTFPDVPSNTPHVFLGNSNASNRLYNGISTTAPPTTAAALPPTSTTITSFNPFNAFATYFYRWNTAMDPGTAWRYYMKGNGQNTLLGNMSAYGVNMQVTQNNVVASTYALL
jgi:hypothetical protein